MKIGLNARGAKVGKKTARLYLIILCFDGFILADFIDVVIHRLGIIIYLLLLLEEQISPKLY